jgi:FkbM family methyltransferase
MSLGVSYYSQFGEERVLHSIFGDTQGKCIEVGGFDGVIGSNTFCFEQLGWSVVIIEADPDLCNEIANNRPGSRLVRCAASDVRGEVSFNVACGVEALSAINPSTHHIKRVRKESGTFKKIIVLTRRLDEIISDIGWSHIDFITVDVEGHEFQVFQVWILMQSIFVLSLSSATTTTMGGLGFYLKLPATFESKPQT